MASNIKNYYKDNKLFSVLSTLIYTTTLLASMDIFYYFFISYLTGLSFYFIITCIVLIICLHFRKIRLTKLRYKLLLSFVIWATIHIFVNQFCLNYKYSNDFFGLSFNITTIQVIITACIVLSFLFFDSLDNEIIKNNIIKIILFSIVIDAIVTLRALAIDPGISRAMASGLEELNSKGLRGVSGFGLIYGLVIIMPMIYYSIIKLKTRRSFYAKLLTIYKIKEIKNNSSLLLQTFALLTIYLVYKADYTIALILIIIGVLIYLFLNSSTKIKLTLFPLILFSSIPLINPTRIYNAIKYLADKIPQLSIKLNELAVLVLFGQAYGDTLARTDRYQKSIDAFFRHPITGISIFDANYQFSGHSAFLDILGSSGLVGFIPYLLFIWYSYKIAVNKTEDKLCKNAIKTSYIIFCFFASLNPLNTSFTIMLFLLFFVTWYPSFVEHISTNQNTDNKIEIDTI